MYHSLFFRQIIVSVCKQFFFGVNSMCFCLTHTHTRAIETFTRQHTSTSAITKSQSALTMNINHAHKNAKTIWINVSNTLIRSWSRFIKTSLSLWLKNVFSFSLSLSIALFTVRLRFGSINKMKISIISSSVVMLESQGFSPSFHFNDLPTANSKILW